MTGLDAPATGFMMSCSAPSVWALLVRKGGHS